MGRRFKLSNDWYGDGCNIFKKKQITIDTGLTVLVGCNGAGKTTMLNQINQILKNENIPVLFHSNLKSGEKDFMARALFYSDLDTVAKTMMSSEGENIINVMEDIARKMGVVSRDNSGAKELWFLFDSIDSGLSVDNIIEFKENLVNFVIGNEKNKDVYFLVSANEFELARNEKCFDVENGRYITFKDYDEYREFILKSKEQKLKRYDR